MPYFDYESRDGVRHERFYPIGGAPKRIRVDGETCVRVVSSFKLGHSRSGEFEKPIVMYSEFKKGEGPTAHIDGKFDNNNFRVMTNVKEKNEYESRSADAGYPVKWSRDMVMDTRNRETYRPEK